MKNIIFDNHTDTMIQSSGEETKRVIIGQLMRRIVVYLESIFRFAHMETANSFQKEDELTLFSESLTIKVNNSKITSIRARKKFNLYGLVFVANHEHLKHPLF